MTYGLVLVYVTCISMRASRSELGEGDFEFGWLEKGLAVHQFVRCGSCERELFVPR